MILLLSDKTFSLSDVLCEPIKLLAEKMGKTYGQNVVYDIDTVPESCESQAADLLFLLLPNKARLIQKYLNVCRSLRVPYVFVTDQMTEDIHFQRILLPVGFLEEEIGKAQFASAFGRFCHSEILLLQANDYGSRAQIHLGKIRTILDKFGLSYEVIKARKDSFKLENEAAERAEEFQADLLIMSASRDYGLDDVLFGPKERHVICRSSVPVMLLNPRKDLYTLCD